MNIFRSRKTAVAVTAACVLATTLLGSHRSLAAERRAVEATMNQGADGSGASIGGDLKRACDIAANLHTVARKYLAQTNPTSLSRLDAARQGLESAQTAGERKAALETLLGESQGVAEELSEHSEVSEADRVYLAGFQIDLAAIADTVRRDPYNALAREFNEEILGRFPANALARITGVRPLETFD